MSVSQFGLRYPIPPRYGLLMKTLTTSLKFDTSDVAKFRLHVLEHMELYGYKSAVNAFGVKKSTLYDWRKAFVSSQKRLLSLVPRSTRPHRVRRMHIHPDILLFIRSVREQYGRVGKKKLKLLVDAYAQELGLESLGTTAIEKLVRRNHWYFEGTRKWKQRRSFQRKHTKYAPKETLPGYLEMDSITVTLMSRQYRFMTVIDVVTKVAWCRRVSRLTALNARLTFHEFQQQYPQVIRVMQTDNGSEFLAEFHDYLETEAIEHCFIYPRSPRINGVIERFNRTIQEEFLQRCIELDYDLPAFSGKLTAYLDWYNMKRPHSSLGYVTPAQYQTNFHSGM